MFKPDTLSVSAEVEREEVEAGDGSSAPRSQRVYTIRRRERRPHQCERRQQLAPRGLTGVNTPDSFHESAVVALDADVRESRLDRPPKMPRMPC